MHRYVRGCFAPRHKAADVEQGRALSEFPYAHQSSADTLVNNVTPAENHVTTAGSVDSRPEASGRREPRGKKDLKPVQLSNTMRDEIDADARTARVTQRERDGDDEEGDMDIRTSRSTQ